VPDGITRVGITETCPSTTDTDNDDDSTLTTTNGCPEGQERDKNGNCYTPGVSGRTIVDDDLTVADITANTPCDNADEVRDPVTLVCGKPTGGGGTDKIICPDTYNNAKAEVDSLDQCGGLKSTGGGQTKVVRQEHV
jgi:hypothetical protein